MIPWTICRKTSWEFGHCTLLQCSAVVQCIVQYSLFHYLGSTGCRVRLQPCTSWALAMSPTCRALPSLCQVQGPAFNDDVSPLRGPQVQGPSYREDGSTLRGLQGHVQGHGQSYREDEEVAALRLTPGQYRAQQEAWFTQQREAQERQTRQHQQHTQRQPQPPYNQQQFNQQQQIQYQQQMQFAQEQYLLQQQQQQEHLNSVGRVDTRITAPPSFPHSPPRKQSAPHTPTMYQNIPTNSRAYSDPRPPVYNRLESVTPNPRSSREALDSDNSRGSAGDFRRSASARLARNKDREGDSRDGRDSHNHTFTEESGDSNRSGDQVGVSQAKTFQMWQKHY